MENLSKVERRKHAGTLIKLKRQLRDAQLKRWVIRYSWKHGYPTGDPLLWQSWRSNAVVGKLFRSETEAQSYMDEHVFKNMRHLRKLTACIAIIWLKEK